MDCTNLVIRSDHHIKERYFNMELLIRIILKTNELKLILMHIYNLFGEFGRIYQRNKAKTDPPK